MAECSEVNVRGVLNNHFLNEYMEDAVAQMLIKRDQGNIGMNPSKFFKEYFTRVHLGTHILFREFKFVMSTPYNRLCLVRAILQIWKHLINNKKRYNAAEYYAMLQEVWPDFDMSVIQDAITAYDDDKKDEENYIEFIDFVKAMKASFCSSDIDFETSIIDNHIKNRIIEYSSNVANESGDTPMALTEADILLKVEEDNIERPSGCASKILDEAEFEAMLNLSDFKSSNEPVSGEKLSTSSSSSKEVSKKSSKDSNKSSKDKKERWRY